MAPVHGKDTRIFLGNPTTGYEVTTFLSKVTRAGEVDAAPADTFGETGKSYLGGIPSAKLELEGLFSSNLGTTADAIDDILSSLLGAVGTNDPTGTTDTSPVAIVLPTANSTYGDVAHSLVGIESSYEVESPVDGLVSVKAELMGDRHIDLGKYIMGLTNAAGGGAQTAVDDGAAAPGLTAAATLFYCIYALTGTGTWTIKLQDSSDNVSFADVTGLSFGTGGVSGLSAQKLRANVALRRYVRGLITRASGTGTISMVGGYARHFS